MQYLTIALTVALLITLPPMGAARTEGPKESPRVDVREFMTAHEFKSAGLEKLSPDELQALNQWLEKFMLRILQRGEGRGCTDTIESQIDGTFEGWSGETIFKLTNGQIWQQASYAYTYHYAYRPEVIIYPFSGGCRMKVEDVDDSIPVKRLK
jgi:hypothetical protein